MEFERFSHSEENGAARIYRFSLLVTDSLLFSHSDFRIAVSVSGTSESFRGIRATAQLLLQPFPICDPYKTI